MWSWIQSATGLGGEAPRAPATGGIGELSGVGQKLSASMQTRFARGVQYNSMCIFVIEWPVVSYFSASFSGIRMAYFGFNCHS